MRDAMALAVFALIGYATFTVDAYAYLDPGSASIILQGIIGGIAAGAATLAFYWQRVKHAIVRMVGRGDANRSNEK